MIIIRHASCMYYSPHTHHVHIRFWWCLAGAAMGSPLSPIVANIYMEHFETRALETAPHPQAFGRGMWMTLLSS